MQTNVRAIQHRVAIGRALECCAIHISSILFKIVYQFNVKKFYFTFERRSPLVSVKSTSIKYMAYLLALENEMRKNNEFILLRSLFGLVFVVSAFLFLSSDR